MSYEMDMSGEKEKKRTLILPEGWRTFEILSCEENTSKKGNQMFVMSFLDVITQQAMDVYAIAVPKKRWFLKQVLAACSVPAAEDGVYKWDIDNVLGKTVLGYVENVTEPWIGRDGNQRSATKSKIIEVKEVGPEDPPIAEPGKGEE